MHPNEKSIIWGRRIDFTDCSQVFVDLHAPGGVPNHKSPTENHRVKGFIPDCRSVVRVSRRCGRLRFSYDVIPAYLDLAAGVIRSDFDVTEI